MNDNESSEGIVTKYPNYFAYNLIMKKGAIEQIKKIKGWKTDAEMAKHLGFTAAYIGRLKNRIAKVSDNVIVRLAVALGSIGHNWWIFYEIRPTNRVRTANSREFNQEKYQGNMPYDRYSIAAEIRKQQGEKVEFIDEEIFSQNA